jgi:PAS domain S-box-containing protein
MNSTRPWRVVPQSLRFKVTAGVMLVLAVAMGLVFAVQYRWFEQDLIDRLGLSSAPLSDVIKGSLKHAMQTRDPSELAAIVDNVSRQEGVRKVFVVDKRGVIKVSPVREEIGTTLPLDDPTCQVCHRTRPEQRSHTVIFTTASGDRVFRNVNPIANEPACFGCHDRRQAMNGVLISDFSMAPVDRQLADRRRQMLLGTLLAVAGTGVMITLIMNRLVIAKLERFVRATKLLGRGSLDLKIEHGPNDELGELATSFNEMVAGLRRAKELRERQELLENVLDNVDDFVVVFEPGGAVLALNGAGERAFGVRAGEAVGRAMALLGEDTDALLGRAWASGPFSQELRLRAADGRYFPTRLHLVPLRSEQDRPLACVAIGQDLTEEKAQERLRQQVAQSEKLAATGRLAAGVAHELNNPLGNVLLHAKLLLEDLPEGDGRRGGAQRIVDNTLRCKAIVRGLLDSARQSELVTAWTDVNETARKCVELVAAEPGAARAECRLQLDPALPRIECDARQIEQVLVNLLRNAIDAINGRGGTVTVFTEPAADGEAIVLGVRDDGCGITADGLSRVFEPFYTTKEQGMGLGLAICHGIVERHKGRIWAESASGAPGSTFYVRLPVGA